MYLNYHNPEVWRLYCSILVFNKIATQNDKLQMASWQGSHMLIKSSTWFIKMRSRVQLLNLVYQDSESCANAGVSKFVTSLNNQYHFYLNFVFGSMTLV